MKRILFLSITLAVSVSCTVSVFGNELAAVADPIIEVGNANSINVRAGEAQSTVVPPDKNRFCQSGRFLVSDDLVIYTNNQTRPGVFGRNLNSLGANNIQSTFDSVPTQGSILVGQDHDMVTLNNGEVLYLTAVSLRMPLTNKPAWFDIAYRDDFGPGARTGIGVWRSRDCGNTFQWMTLIDTALLELGGGSSCGMPQLPRKTTAPGTTAKPVYDMGGSDGPLAKVDAATGKVYMTIQCVGYKQKSSSSNVFELDETKPLNTTVVMVSSNNGNSWGTLGLLPARSWRFGIAPFESNRIVFGTWNALFFGKINQDKDYEIESMAQRPPGGAPSWNFAQAQPLFYNKDNNPTGAIAVNIANHPIVVRSPGTPNDENLIFADPGTITANGKSSLGFNLWLFNRTTRKWLALDPIVPTNQNLNSIAMHLVAIDLGKGPVMLYWTDVDGATKKAKVRGRVITGDGEYSDDFNITADTWSLDHPTYWYGDYQTAGGYIGLPPQRGFPNPRNFTIRRQGYTFYPMWIQPDNTIRFAQVTVKPAPQSGGTGDNSGGTNIGIPRLPNMRRIPLDLIPGPPPVDIRQYRYTPFHQTTLNRYDRQVTGAMRRQLRQQFEQRSLQ